MAEKSQRTKEEEVANLEGLLKEQHLLLKNYEKLINEG